MFRNSLLTLASFFVLCSCNPENAHENKSDHFYGDAPLFDLLPSSYTGIDFSNNLKEDVHDETRNILSWEYYFNGAGVAVVDINNDGLPDLFFTGNEVDNKLYLNKGDLKFENISERAKINIGKSWATGVTTVDINQDGWMDIYVCQSGAPSGSWSKNKNLLFVNNGDLTFTEQSSKYGLDDTNMSTQAAFFDYDKDGDLDCFVLNESKYNQVVHATIFKELEVKENLNRASSNLYKNENGAYSKVTEEAGMLKWGFGLGLAVSDINMDGWPDVYVANDYSVPDFLYINNGDGTFTDQIKEMTNQISFYSMGIDIADINNDGLLDMSIVDMAADDHVRAKTLMASMDIPTFWYYIYTRDYHYQYMFNALQLNNGNNTFSNIALMAGVAQTDWSWASLLADFDNDGFKDLFVTNGYRRYARDNDFRNKMSQTRDENGGTIPSHLRQEMYDLMPTFKSPNRMFKNDGQLTFKSIEDKWGTDQPSYSNGAAYADLDQDGDLDLVVNNIDMEAFVYKNNARSLNQNHYLRVELKGELAGSSVNNSLVSIFYDGQEQVQELMNTRGYESSVEEILHFGLGSNLKVDRLEVKWPNGKTQVVSEVPIDQKIVIRQNDANSSILNRPKNKFLLQEKDALALGVDYVHKENEFDDFAKEILLPQKQSTHGPCIAVADVNGDGLDDFYVGGAAGNSGIMYIQNSDGSFGYETGLQIWAFDKANEDVGALFFDADGDGDQDLYVVSGGGGEFEVNAQELSDRLYINTGAGKFMTAKQSLPPMFSPGSCVKAADYDNDGDMDLFVGGRAIPGKYPSPSRSYLLNFDNFRYTDVTERVAPELLNPGLVTDAIWTDFNKDGMQDLVIVGEWMAPSFYQNSGGSFLNVTLEKGTADLKGWWYSISEADVDNDGDLDFICGNLGLNSKFKASKEHPFNVFSKDFDENGTYDIVLSKEYDGKLVPTRGKECSSQQMPFIKDKFTTYNDFAIAGIEDILGKEKLSESLHLFVNDFESIVLINNGNGTYSKSPLPPIAQASPINGIIVKDVNNDGNLDLIIAGNMYNTEVETPRYDAGTGLILFGDGTGKFQAISSGKSGFYAPKDVKDIALIRQKNNDMIMVVNNNGPLQFFEIK